jgi:hypothetical protein
MIRMIATTMSSSISEKPFCLRIQKSPLGIPILCPGQRPRLNASEELV